MGRVIAITGRVYSIACLRNLHPPTRQDRPTCENMHWRLPGSGLRKYAHRQNHTIPVGVGRFVIVCVKIRGIVLRPTGGVRAEHAYSGTSWGALTLEVGKSPTATRWRAELPVV